MADSIALLNARIGFLDTRLALIHIPLHLYPHFLGSILQLLFHNPHNDADGNTIAPNRPWLFWHPFVNVSITSTECSIVCPRQQAQDLFAPILLNLKEVDASSVDLSIDDYSAIVIGGEGLEAGQRVLDLTSPLALAGISIFFITSYWSDFILVPLHTRSTVIHALEERGFVFESDDTAGETGHMTNPSSPLIHPNRNGSVSSFDFPKLPGTPPPSTINELQERTFRTLAKNKVSPSVDDEVDLVTCAGVKDYTLSSFASKFTAGKLDHGLMQCLSAPQRPKFFSITLTATESASLTTERRFLKFFSEGGEDVLLGTDGPRQIPITFDLSQLPLQSTGIVCGVSSKLIDGMKGRISNEVFNMSYLSTAKAGHVIVYDEELDDALASLGATNGATVDAA